MLRGIHTVLFDLDGTLTVPVLDFNAIRRELGLPAGVSIVHALRELPDAERAAREDTLRRLELEAAALARPNRGATELVRALQHRQIATAIITRNFRQAAEATLDALGLRFPVLICRDSAAPKPSPEAVHEALHRLKRDTAGALMVGDFADDMQAGRAAGVRTCMVTNGGPPRFEADMHVASPADLLAQFESAWAAENETRGDESPRVR